MYKQISKCNGMKPYERYITDAACVILLTKMVDRQHRNGSYAEFTFSRDRETIEVNWGDATRHITTTFIHTPESMEADEKMSWALETLDDAHSYPLLEGVKDRYLKAKNELTPEQQAEITLYE